MIRRIQALGYRCLRYVDVRLDRFHVLVGPNASGRSTLFDVVAFLGDLVEDGLEAAVEQRTRNFQDLVWRRPNKECGFELAVEFDLPQEVRSQLPAARDFRVFRYELAIREDDKGVLIDSERGILMPEPKSGVRRGSLFPDPVSAPDTVLLGKPRGIRTILSKSREGRDTFKVEVSERAGGGWVTSVSFGARRSALGNLPESSEKFPAATYVKQILQRRIKPLFLDSIKMRQASPPHLRRGDFSPDGSNLPWAVSDLKKNHREDYDAWMRHVQTILADLKDIRILIRKDDRHAYLRLLYDTGARVPSWMTSDGTLRFLALTLLAYLPSSEDVYLLEESEHGVHPLALDAVYDSLVSVYDSQVLVATHSPTFLKLAGPEDVLCFAKDDEGATDVVRGDDHPLLKDWHGSADMSLLFAAGVIG